MQKVRRLIKYILYLITAKHKKGFGVHSPFLYKIITDIICDTNPYYAMDDIWEIRQNLLADNRKIKVADFGAGSHKLKSEERKISEIAKCSAVKVKYGEFLFRLVNYLKPQNIIELGTSVGLGTLYLALPNKSASVKTIEGCPNISKAAKLNFEKNQVTNIEQFTGNFDEILPKIIKDIKSIDFVYFDGNHRKEPTLRYFESCLTKINNNTVFVFDDIHWSKDMESAWEEIKKHDKVKLTIDIFFQGLVFFRKELSKENYIVKF